MADSRPLAEALAGPPESIVLLQPAARAKAGCWSGPVQSRSTLSSNIRQRISRSASIHHMQLEAVYSEAGANPLWGPLEAVFAAQPHQRMGHWVQRCGTTSC